MNSNVVRLTESNFKDVGNRILAMLRGKRYAFTVASPENDYRPKVYNDLFLDDTCLGFNSTGFVFSDSYGTWGCSYLDDVEIVFNNDAISFAITVGNNKPRYWSIYISN